MLYTWAQTLTSQLPDYLGSTLSTTHPSSKDNLHTIALVNAISLLKAGTLRLLVLYPLYAIYIYTEAKQVTPSQPSDNAQHETTNQNRSSAGIKTLWNDLSVCFVQVTAWFALLHLQTAVLLTIVEGIAAPLFFRMVF
jgi:hypothetical protein